MSLNQYFLVTISVFLFLYGFFPVSEVPLNPDNEPPIQINNISLNKEKMYTSAYRRTAIIVIDALRLDFVNTNDMPLTSKLVQQNGCFCKVKVEAPTVTLPRIKSLTAGNVPQFIDLVLNLASTEILKDSIIHSAQQSGKKVVFYGDDTWLKLFPDKFYRYEGTTSFFVKDFTEVDDNVTRNVEMELENSDWDIMILHYLGLDHIGHVYGPFSSLVPNKLNEMDEIVHKIHDNMKTKNDNTLLIVTGDHGMRDSGGHGGSTYSETHVPFLIIGHQCDSSSFPQTDIPVNLAVLLGLRIPASTIGRLQRNLLPFNLEKYLYMLHYNTLLLGRKSSLGREYFERASAYHEHYLKTSDEVSAQTAIELYEYCSEVISQSLIKMSTEQKSSCIIFALMIMLSILPLLILQITGASRVPQRINCIGNIFMSLFISSYFLTSHYALVFVFIILSIMLVLNWQSLNIKVTGLLCPGIQAQIVSRNSIPRSFSTGVQDNIDASITEQLGQAHLRYFNSTTTKNTTIFLVLFSVIQPLTFISSSFIEEEHQYWYFFYNLMISFSIINIMKQRCLQDSLQDICLLLFLLIAFRFLRNMNSTGDMWGNQPDISDWLLKEENIHFHQLFFILELILVFLAQIILMRDAIMYTHVANFVILSLIFLYKNSDDNVVLGRIIWLSILCHFVLLHTSRTITWILISCLMLKPYNVILVPYCIFSSLIVSKHLKQIENVFFHSLLGNLLFFAQGHSNSLASVDVSIGYIGLEKYNAIFVIAQVLCHTYVFPVLCHVLIFRKKRINKNIVWKTLFTYRLYTHIVVCIVTLIFRHHLFIWSVFAPKLFIESIHTVFLFIEIFYINTSAMLSSFSKKYF
ncbi:unnamed protein product [Phaedon cochleariae]|uniref:GPI ethanolamine phosphate transferase 2 C-terminal domain-containing protein n=1 Tax=Phaedon cochleariae TaxID=80249 RepID=A0A9P0DC27_PHACE|nr:unnamed protein product [Phaedon cochleariae]